MTTSNKLTDVVDRVAAAVGVAQDKGYILVSGEVAAIDVQNNNVTLSLRYYDEQYSGDSVTKSGSIDTVGGLADALFDAATKLPMEADDRKQRFVRDLGQMLDRARMMDFEATYVTELESLMKRMSENILPPPDRDDAAA